MGAFSVFSDRKYKKKNTQTPTVEQYYESRARRVSAIRWCCLLCTVLFILYGFSIHGDELTVENFRYMLNFVEFTEKETPGISLVTFDYGEENRGAIYKDDVVVLNKTGLSVYSEDADRVLNVAFRMDDPRLTVAGPEVLAYDLGGHEVRMFNSYSQLACLTMSYPVYGLSGSESGSFAVITSEKNYRTTVVVYDQYAGERFHRSLSTTFVDQVALSPDGEELLTLGHYSKNGSLVSILQYFSLREKEPLREYTFTGELPLQVAWLGDGTYAALTGENLRVFRTDAEDPTAVYPLGNVSLQNSLIGNGSILLVTAAEGISGGTVLTVLNDRLETTLVCPFDGSVEGMTVIEDNYYVLLMGSVTCLSASGEEKTVMRVSKDALAVLEGDDHEPLLFEKNRVIRLRDAEKDAETSGAEGSGTSGE